MRKLIGSFVVALGLLSSSVVGAQTLTKGIQYNNQSSVPCAPNTSCMWIDSTNKLVHFYDGTTAKTIPAVPASVKGTLPVFDGTLWSAFPPGVDGQCLQSQSGQASGLQWGACSSGIGGTLANGQVAVGTAANTIGGTPNFTADTSGNVSVASSVATPLVKSASSVTVQSSAADAPSAVSLIVDTVAAWTAGKIASFRSGGVEHASILFDGNYNRFLGAPASGGTLFLDGSLSGVLATPTIVSLLIGGSNTLVVTPTDVSPAADLTLSIGDATHRPTEVWARHFAGSQTTPPTITIAGGLVGFTPSLVGSDASMVITLTTVLGSCAFVPSSPYDVATVSYNAAYAVKPKGINITPVNDVAVDEPTLYINYDAAGTNTGGFVIRAAPGKCFLAGTNTPKYSVTFIQ